MRIAFEHRDVILDPIAVGGLGPAAHSLAHRLLDLDGAQLGRLRGAAGHGVLIALGETSDLPWAEGVFYLGREAEAPKLLVPTTVRPVFAGDVIERAVARHTAPLPGPWALLHSPPLIFSLAQAAAIERGELRKW